MSKLHGGQKGFTLIEILIVVMLLGVLYSIATVSYSSIRQRSQDAKRKTDMEEIRSGLEQYRSNNNAYPTPTGTSGLPFGAAPLTDGAGNVYLQTIPQDPISPHRTYYYTVVDDQYTLGVQLTYPETVACTTPPGGDSCGTGLGCNYCMGPYGKL